MVGAGSPDVDSPEARRLIPGVFDPTNSQGSETACRYRSARIHAGSSVGDRMRLSALFASACFFSSVVFSSVVAFAASEPQTSTSSVEQPVDPSMDQPADPSVDPLVDSSVDQPVDQLVDWDDFDEPEFDPTATPPASPATPVSQASEGTSSRASSIPLGPLGIDDQGIRGRIHTVSTGETLWDISDAYLGTPWVWPSVWSENTEIENPHVIEPGDQLWITSNLMRRVSPTEAGELMSSAATPEPEEEVAETVVAAFAEPPEEGPLEMLSEEPELEALPSLDPMASLETGQMLTIPREQAANLVTNDVIDAASSIIDSPTMRVMLTQGDEVYIGLGDGEVAPGDEFAIYRDVRQIRDPRTRALLGHHIEQLGWLRVRSVEGESATATIEEATDEMKRGDSIVPREELEQEVVVRRAEPGTEGMIALTPGHRHLAGSMDSVYLNLGSIHGIELGTRLKVYSGTGDELSVPGAVIAEMVVIRVEPEVSVAFVTQTQKELEVGELVYGPMDSAGGGGQKYSQR